MLTYLPKVLPKVVPDPNPPPKVPVPPSVLPKLNEVPGFWPNDVPKPPPNVEPVFVVVPKPPNKDPDCVAGVVVPNPLNNPVFLLKR